jgi:uncharacterized protein YjbI with pentapeptide repeats
VGVTTVSCIATDTAGNTASATFLVVVSALTSDCNLSHYRVAKGGLDLRAANLSGCYLPNSSFAGANAAGANLHGAYLDGSTVTKASLTSTDITAAYIRNVDFTGSDFSRANLTAAKATGSIFTRVKWLQTICVDGSSSSAAGGSCAGHL